MAGCLIALAESKEDLRSFQLLLVAGDGLLLDLSSQLLDEGRSRGGGKRQGGNLLTREMSKA